MSTPELISCRVSLVPVRCKKKVITLSENSSFGQHYITVESLFLYIRCARAHEKYACRNQTTGKNKGAVQLNDKVRNFVFYVLNKDICFILTVALI